ncbi:18293_t:CDS:2, partial [Entrophospora sp. SA101]
DQTDLIEFNKESHNYGEPAFHEDEENEMNINYDRINDDSIIEIANSIHPQ